LIDCLAEKQAGASLSWLSQVYRGKNPLMLVGKDLQRKKNHDAIYRVNEEKISSLYDLLPTRTNTGERVDSNEFHPIQKMGNCIIDTRVALLSTENFRISNEFQTSSFEQIKCDKKKPA